MYLEKIEDILNDVENKDTEIAGGAVVGIILSTINSLIIYISNLTIGKKKYFDVQEEVKEIIEQANNLKIIAMKSIDKDKEILEEILLAYKNRKENPKRYQNICIKATEFSIDVIETAYKTMNLSKEISKVGNKMLESDFNICKYYAEASIKASKENYYINFNSIEDINCKEKVKEKYLKIIDKYEVK